ncbi:hypothetical protein MNEG_2174 [Monoraphidium neglectum]|uniref:Zinc-finger domain-containing protein n=1 Tax=Monoraphidium neglectum TaxID=145388 RepID=A0A0D2MT89_9CHLO|nr:hypothetical protein MNEG_2174 [Monoraphidium neglectum]KIZ05790.1 hypothetical protein MNEG_2174 [Monoraphidium neglectum]|eukprot:XP_013904809.1 hypothetical protein MNEG_2174 [Monoraphidium neglectum]
MAEEKTAYELERERRIEANKQKIAELGIHDSVAAVQQLADARPTRPKRARAAPSEPVDPQDIRRSARPRSEVNYKVDLPIRGEGGAARDPIDYTEKIKQLQLDSNAAEKLRAELEAKRATEGETKARKAAASKATRGPKDSGKGVRVQGGRVYDSKFGVTCHCHKCLKNRHGEDAEAAAESAAWVCPACRGSCGPGCVICCNCGPCRKKASLEPTAQIVFLARSAGFSNVHDYLVHLVTGEKEEDIAARKAKASWGGWLRGEGNGCEPDAQAAEAEAGAEEEEGEGPQRKKPARGRKASGAGRGGKGAAASETGAEQEAEAAAPEALAPAAGAAGKGAARRKTGGSGGARGRKAAAAPAAEADAAAEAAAAAASQEDVAAPAAPDQDCQKLSRKARMMQRMGLAPRAESEAAPA